MRLLIVTQAVDERDPVLGFFVRWIQEFASHTESIEVVCLREGHYTLPRNVRVHSLGKERGRPTLSSFAYALRFLTLSWRLRHEYDVVFVHMNPEYLDIAGWLWRLLGKRTVLWYTHKHVDLKLRIAVSFADAVCSASKESFRLKTPKLRIMGHGIDTERFVLCAQRETGDTFRLVSIGRIAPVKGYELMFDALEKLGSEYELVLIGGTVTPADEAYLETLKTDAVQRSLRVVFEGPIRPTDVPTALCRADVFLNASATGSLDKAILETMAAGVPVVTSNEGLRSTLASAPAECRVVSASADAFAEAVRRVRTLSGAERVRIGSALREIVVKEHALPALIAALVRVCENAA